MPDGYAHVCLSEGCATVRADLGEAVSDHPFTETAAAGFSDHRFGTNVGPTGVFHPA